MRVPLPWGSGPSRTIPAPELHGAKLHIEHWPVFPVSQCKRIRGPALPVAGLQRVLGDFGRLDGDAVHVPAPVRTMNAESSVETEHSHACDGPCVDAAADG